MCSEPQVPHFSFRGFAFLVMFCVLCFSSLTPQYKPLAETWHLFIAAMVFCIFQEVWHIRNPRPCHESKKIKEE